MPTPSTWHDHAETVLRKESRRRPGGSGDAATGSYQERYIVRNAAGEPLRGGLLVPGAVIPLNPGEDIQVVSRSAPALRLADSTYGAAYQAGYDAGRRIGEVHRFLEGLAIFLVGLALGIAGAATYGLF